MDSSKDIVLDGEALSIAENISTVQLTLQQRCAAIVAGANRELERARAGARAEAADLFKALAEMLDIQEPGQWTLVFLNDGVVFRPPPDETSEEVPAVAAAEERPKWVN